MRILTNIAILVLELGLISATAWLAYIQPLAFAALTVGLILVVGAGLEWARLNHEFPFYVGNQQPHANSNLKSNSLRTVILLVMACSEVIIKALLAGGVALMTFSGSDANRLWLTAVLFGTVTFLGTSVLRRLSRSFDVRPTRWGYFRLAVPLGVAFSLGIQMLVYLDRIELKTLQEIATTIVFELPAHPSLPQVSEFLFNIKQTLDALIYEFLKQLITSEAASAVATLISLNILSGLVVAIYAVLIADVVRRLEAGGNRQPCN